MPNTIGCSTIFLIIMISYFCIYSLMWQLFKIIFVNFGCFLKDCKTDSRKITCLNETQR